MVVSNVFPITAWYDDLIYCYFSGVCNRQSHDLFIVLHPPEIGERVGNIWRFPEMGGTSKSSKFSIWIYHIVIEPFLEPPGL